MGQACGLDADLEGGDLSFGEDEDEEDDWEVVSNIFFVVSNMFYFQPNWGKWSKIDYYFSTGLKAPTR